MKVINLNSTPKDEAINQAVKVLQAGGLIIYPTETVYGLGVDATNQAAVDKLLRFKSRREGKPLSVAVSSQEMAQKYVELNQQAKNLYQEFLPGPITVVSKGKHQVAYGVESEFGTLGVRMPDYPLIIKIVEKLNKPITATSANASGKPRPYSLETILKHTSSRQQELIDLVLDAGTLPKNPPSTVIDTTLSTPITMRQGSLQLDQNGKTQSKQKVFLTSSSQETQGLAGRLLLKYWQDLTTTGLVIGLSGPLGAGKTTFTQGLASYLGIDETITSPTYTYMQEYDWQKQTAKGKLYHFDLWRVDDSMVLERLEINKLIAPSNLVVIEWWEKGFETIKPMVKNSRLLVVKLIDIGDKKRKVSLFY